MVISWIFIWNYQRSMYMINIHYCIKCVKKGDYVKNVSQNKYVLSLNYELIDVPTYIHAQYTYINWFVCICASPCLCSYLVSSKNKCLFRNINQHRILNLFCFFPKRNNGHWLPVAHFTCCFLLIDIKVIWLLD